VELLHIRAGGGMDIRDVPECVGLIGKTLVGQLGDMVSRLRVGRPENGGALLD
jgi:hypothetical protein